MNEYDGHSFEVDDEGFLMEFKNWDDNQANLEYLMPWVNFAAQPPYTTRNSRLGRFFIVIRLTAPGQVEASAVFSPLAPLRLCQ